VFRALAERRKGLINYVIKYIMSVRPSVCSQASNRQKLHDVLKIFVLLIVSKSVEKTQAYAKIGNKKYHTISIEL